MASFGSLVLLTACAFIAGAIGMAQHEHSGAETTAAPADSAPGSARPEIMATADVFANTSACAELRDTRGTKDPWGVSGEFLKFLGTTQSMEACTAAAVKWKNKSDTAQRCLSTCWWRAPQNESFVDQCYCRVTPTWMPLPSPKADSAVINWPCASAADCSYNGKCSAAGGGGCECDAAWTGVRCGELALLPANHAAPGFRETASDGSNISTWGSPVVWDEKGKQWHGWASEMMHGWCEKQ